MSILQAGIGLFMDKLEKLKIYSYSDPKRDKRSEVESFEVMFNPDTYSLNFKNVYDPNQGQNSSSRPAIYSRSEPSKLRLKLIMDGTGVTEESILGFTDPEDVHDQVQRFMKMAYKMDGQLHEPRFLVIHWGSLVYKCRLDSVDIKYSLFNKQGRPLRAELNTVFLHDIEKNERLKLEEKASPDLTHSRIVGAHDQLPIMCAEIYGSPHYYIQVAKANNLKDFRNLTPGQEIFFPPIEK